MTSTERKRRWRERNPERSRGAERDRAQRRRNAYGSYMDYEQSMNRFWQRFWYPIRGAGGRHMTVEQWRAAIDARFAREWAALRERYAAHGLTLDEDSPAALTERHGPIGEMGNP